MPGPGLKILLGVDLADDNTRETSVDKVLYKLSIILVQYNTSTRAIVLELYSVQSVVLSIILVLGDSTVSSEPA